MNRNNYWLTFFVLISLSINTFAKDRGESVFQLCMSCHGQQGYGTPKLGAPAIAGLPEWYLQGQLEKFAAGGRGLHPSDDAGHRMAPMARTLSSEDIKLVSAYVSKLPVRSPANTVGGDIEKGKAAYGVCLACHGPTGDGNEALHAPSLKISNDWYLVRQLNNFKNKIRAYDPAKDPNGMLMAPMAASLPDEQAMKDVITYVQSLK